MSETNEITAVNMLQCCIYPADGNKTLLIAKTSRQGFCLRKLLPNQRISAF